MRASVLLVSVFAMFVLSGCNEQSGSYVGGVAYDSAVMESAELSAAPMARKQALSQSSPPSQMALDRSKFNNRRIAETHNLNVEMEPDDVKARYDRDFKKCLALGCEISNSNAQSRRSAYINARIAPENLGEYLDFLGTGPGELKEH